MFTARKLVLGISALAVCITVGMFMFHEGVRSTIERSIQKTQNSLKSNENGSSSSLVASGPDVARENATFFTLCRNSDIHGILKAISSVESKFNNRFHYDWVFLNDEEFTSDFKREIQDEVSGQAHFGKINETMWGYPEWIDREEAAKTRKWMKDHNVIYGNLESYHHMCRFQSAFFYRHPLMMNYRYSWRVEPDISILCKQKLDPFRLMRVNEMKYGFNVAPQDIRESVTTLWSTTKEFVKLHPEYVVKDNLEEFISDDHGENFNLCHFWSNFEISDLDWLRSKPYQDYVDFLDRAGGFYYERWGDAPVRSIAASLFLPKEDVYFFNDIGYFHSPYGHCPYDQGPLELECDCHPGEGEFSHKFYDYHKDSCMRRYFKAKGRTYHDENPDMDG